MSFKDRLKSNISKSNMTWSPSTQILDLFNENRKF